MAGAAAGAAPQRRSVGPAPQSKGAAQVSSAAAKEAVPQHAPPSWITLEHGSIGAQECEHVARRRDFTVVLVPPTRAAHETAQGSLGGRAQSPAAVRQVEDDERRALVEDEEIARVEVAVREAGFVHARDGRARGTHERKPLAWRRGLER